VVGWDGARSCGVRVVFGGFVEGLDMAIRRLWAGYRIPEGRDCGCGVGGAGVSPGVLSAISEMRNKAELGLSCSAASCAGATAVASGSMLVACGSVWGGF